VIANIRTDRGATAGGLIGNATNSTITNSYWNNASSGSTAIFLNGGNNTLTSQSSWNGQVVIAPLLTQFAGLDAADWSNAALDGPRPICMAR
jgi:hypothetical protein